MQIMLKLHSIAMLMQIVIKKVIIHANTFYVYMHKYQKSTHPCKKSREPC